MVKKVKKVKKIKKKTHKGLAKALGITKWFNQN